MLVADHQSGNVLDPPQLTAAELASSGRAQSSSSSSIREVSVDGRGSGLALALAQAQTWAPLWLSRALVGLKVRFDRFKYNFARFLE